MKKLIVTAALTGAVTVPTQTAHLPYTIEQLADDAERCAKAGAAIIHIHARNQENGAPSSDMEVFGAIMTAIKARTDAVICATTGGAVTMTPAERVRVVPTWQPELASCNMGSMNFSVHPIARRFKPEDYRFGWEPQWLEGSEDFIFPNTFKSIKHFIGEMKKVGTRPEFEVYDVGHLYNLDFMLKEGVVETPIWIQFVMGVLGGIRATMYDLMHMLDTANRLFGPDQFHWSVIGAGYPNQFHMGTAAIMLGGHARVGLEDNIFVRRGELGRNHDMVEKIVRIAGEFEREIATPAEVRAFLNLKGQDQVTF
ncbi:3-keto-5-aminohexanoate cleavage protein [Chloroflexales bacterium ZM16-3]|nr:3-keto-5-aminohexanoate cleavage protein [Chloroflexales bacterium ZM16-3]